MPSYLFFMCSSPRTDPGFWLGWDALVLTLGALGLRISRLDRFCDFAIFFAFQFGVSARYCFLTEPASMRQDAFVLERPASKASIYGFRVSGLPASAFGPDLASAAV